MHFRRSRRSGAVPGVAADDFLRDLDATAAARDVAELVRRGEGWQNRSVLGELEGIEAVESPRATSGSPRNPDC